MIKSEKKAEKAILKAGLLVGQNKYWEASKALLKARDNTVGAHQCDVLDRLSRSMEQQALKREAAAID